MNDLTTEDRKRLTELCPAFDSMPQTLFLTKEIRERLNFFALKNKLVEQGYDLEFEAFTYGKYCDWKRAWKPPKRKLSFLFWLINAPRFAKLVNEWLKGKEAIINVETAKIQGAELKYPMKGEEKL